MNNMKLHFSQIEREMIVEYYKGNPFFKYKPLLVCRYEQLQ
jgi:hypothetical protein